MNLQAIMPFEQVSMNSLQITWAGLDPIMRTVKASNALPESTIARFSHPSFSQLMSEYLVAHVINAERNFYKVDC